MPTRFVQPRQWAATALLPLTALVSSCSESDDEPTEPTTPASITGRVTSVFPTGPYKGTIRVEFNSDNPNDGPKAIVNVTTVTTVLTVARDESDFRSLANGIWVRVWFDGPVMESYPVQGTAGTIVIDSLGSSAMNRTP